MRDDESYASEDAEGESDDEDPDGVVDYAAQSRAKVVHAVGSGEGEFCLSQGSARSWLMPLVG
jgi:hypothetical protein